MGHRKKCPRRTSDNTLLSIKFIRKPLEGGKTRMDSMDFYRVKFSFQFFSQETMLNIRRLSIKSCGNKLKGFTWKVVFITNIIRDQILYVERPCLPCLTNWRSNPSVTRCEILRKSHWHCRTNEVPNETRRDAARCCDTVGQIDLFSRRATSS